MYTGETRGLDASRRTSPAGTRLAGPAPPERAWATPRVLTPPPSRRPPADAGRRPPLATRSGGPRTRRRGRPAPSPSIRPPTTTARRGPLESRIRDGSSSDGRVWKCPRRTVRGPSSSRTTNPDSPGPSRRLPNATVTARALERPFHLVEGGSARAHDRTPPGLRRPERTSCGRFSRRGTPRPAPTALLPARSDRKRASASRPPRLARVSDRDDEVRRDEAHDQEHPARSVSHSEGPRQRPRGR